MRIRKFVGPSLKDATERMKAELGPEAIILASRKVPRSGVAGLVGRESFEITAASDDEPAVAPRRAHQDRADVHSALRSRQAARSETTLDSLRRMTSEFEERPVPASPTAQRRHAMREEGADVSAIREDMASMKAVLRDLADQVRSSRTPSLPEPFRAAFTRLVEAEAGQETSAELVQTVYARLGSPGALSQTSVNNAVLAEIASRIPVAARGAGKRGKRVVALVGPTGVGKTTTIAKLAAISKLVDQEEVALISADTFRIGAIEQLRTFAAIADIPMDVVYRPGDLAGVLKKFRHASTVYIDTVGRSQRKKKEVGDLVKFIHAASPDEVHLVMSASTGLSTMLDILDRFRVAHPTSLLLTKLDEAVHLGPLLNLVKKADRPVSYVAAGQAVPDDISPARAEELAAMIYNGDHHRA